VTMKPPGTDVKAPILSQPQFCFAADVDMLTANNWVARKVLQPTEIGGRQIKGTRLYSITKAFEGRIIIELVKHQKIGPGDAAKAVEAAKIAALATKGGWVEHWARALDANRSLVAAFMVVACSNDCYDAQVINGNASGWPDFSSVPNMRRRFFKHPFLVLPHKDLFVDVWKKCVAMLASEQKQ
jgi:hypothetical protein